MRSQRFSRAKYIRLSVGCALLVLYSAPGLAVVAEYSDLARLLAASEAISGVPSFSASAMIMSGLFGLLVLRRRRG